MAPAGEAGGHGDKSATESRRAGQVRACAPSRNTQGRAVRSIGCVTFAKEIGRRAVTSFPGSPSGGLAESNRLLPSTGQSGAAPLAIVEGLPVARLLTPRTDRAEHARAQAVRKRTVKARSLRDELRAEVVRERTLALTTTCSPTRCEYVVRTRRLDSGPADVSAHSPHRREPDLHALRFDDGACRHRAHERPGPSNAVSVPDTGPRHLVQRRA